MQRIRDWATGRASSAADEGLHETFAELVRRRPDAIALITRDRPITYRELDERADAWAAGLVAAGVGPGRIVPIVLPRSAALVASLLAVLKAGAAYALLDPAWPSARLEDVISQLDAPLVVADVAPTDAVPAWPPARAPRERAPDFVPARVSGSAPCCVFFTSGTTGRPKGVISPHRATARLFPADGFARFGPRTVMPLAAATPWDAFSLELWAMLLTGGTSLVVHEPYLTPDGLRQAVKSHRADTVWLTSTLFNMIVDEDVGGFTGLRQVLTGGERLSGGHVARFLQRHPDIALLNGYGPVESTVFATTHLIVPSDCEHPDGIPLGRPAPGTDVHVLDGERPCAIGEVGELCIAGAGIAIGYLADPELTSAKFVDVPIGGVVRRVYRTGDLGSWGADGVLRFHGRADRQLKVRGHRVEPAEVERTIEVVLPVRACRVLARRDDAHGVVDLVAFCIPHDPADALGDAMATLRSTLVVHQRPSAVVPVAAFPVTAQGKLDEVALLAMAGEAPTEIDPPAAPSPSGGEPTDHLTAVVAATFASVLGRAAVAVDVPFFDLGGTSLDAGRVCARLAGVLGHPAPLSVLYRHQSATALAAHVRVAPEAPAVVDGVPDGVPLTPMQLVFLTRHLMDADDRTGDCVLTWVIDGPVDAARLQRAIAVVHDGHEPLRAAYVADPRPAAVLVDVPPPTLRLLPEQPSVDMAMRAVRDELARALEPTDGVVWRAALVPVAASSAVFGCVVHHIAFDGWSESVLAAELAAAYNDRAGGDSATPAASLRSVYERRGAVQDVARSVLDADELRNTPALEWPPGAMGDATASPGVVSMSVGAPIVGSADALATDAGASRFVVLLWSYARALADVTGQRDFAVGVPVRQRDGIGFDVLVGCHINMVCVRLCGEALESTPAAIRETSRRVARALAAQDVPLPDLLGLVDGRRTGRPPLFQTLFALQDNPEPRLDLTDARTEFVRQPYAAIPLELHAELWPERGGGLRLDLSFRRDAVPTDTAHQLASTYGEALRTMAAGST